MLKLQLGIPKTFSNLRKTSQNYEIRRSKVSKKQSTIPINPNYTLA